MRSAALCKSGADAGAFFALAGRRQLFPASRACQQAAGFEEKQMSLMVTGKISPPPSCHANSLSIILSRMFLLSNSMLNLNIITGKIIQHESLDIAGLFLKQKFAKLLS